MPKRTATLPSARPFESVSTSVAYSRLPQFLTRSASVPGSDGMSARAWAQLPAASADAADWAMVAPWVAAALVPEARTSWPVPVGIVGAVLGGAAVVRRAAA